MTFREFMKGVKTIEDVAEKIQTVKVSRTVEMLVNDIINMSPSEAMDMLVRFEQLNNLDYDRVDDPLRKLLIIKAFCV